jgi:hypothetical protein
VRVRGTAARRDELLLDLRPPDAAGGGGLSAEGTSPREAAGLCPRCREPFDAEQEYCLECGLRLPWESVVFTKLTARTAARTRFLPRDWIWPAALALVVAVAGAAAAIALVRSDASGSDAFAVATGGVRTVPTAVTTVPATPTGAKTTKGKPAKAVAKAGLIRWPRGTNAWTVVLVSLPQTGGGEPARAKADEALRRGLRQVGVIDSSRFASLHPGYYVVFSGVYASEEEATGQLQRAKAVFPLAYTRQIAA